MSVLMNKTFFIFGIIVFFLSIESLIVGEGAKSVTTLFLTDDVGLPTFILLQFLGLSFMITCLTEVTMSDHVFKNYSRVKRLSLLVVLCFLTTLVFIVGFKWFIMDSLISWLYFALCFILSFGLSVLLSITNENIENKKLEDALMSYKAKIVEESSGDSV